MKPAPIPTDETDRLLAVRSLGVLDTPPDERFDRLTRSAVEQLHVPISTVSIIDADREWFKSCVGTLTSEGSRENSFCGHTIFQGHIFIIEDTRKDPRFADNPQVIAPPYIRFYADVTLHDKKLISQSAHSVSRISAHAR